LVCKEELMSDPFIGTWNLNPGRCEFDPNHRPTSGALVFERDTEGRYVMKAEGTAANGQKVVERPQTFIPDGEARPIAEVPGLRARTTQPGPRELHARCEREDGSIVGEGTYVVSPDGMSLTATTAGVDAEKRRFETRTVWDRALPQTLRNATSR
jgi:hypothetical protein